MEQSPKKNEKEKTLSETSQNLTHGDLLLSVETAVGNGHSEKLQTYI